MRIAIFHELHFGGARRAVNEIAKSLKKRHVVDAYIVDEKENYQEREYFSSLKTYRFLSKNYTGGNWKTRFFKDSFELLKLRKLHKQIALDIEASKYDVAFVHPSRFTQAPFLLKFLKLPKVYYAQETLRMIYEPNLFFSNLSFPKTIYENLTRKIRKEIDRQNILAADLLLTNSAFTKKNIRLAYGIESKICYLGVDSQFFHPDNTKKDIDILFIGTKDKVDGYDLLETSLSFLPDIIFHHINTFEHPVSDKELVHFYNRSKIVVCLSRNEPFGLIPLEAMACAVPVIAVCEGGFRESVMHRKTGLLIKRDANELANGIYLLLSDKKLWHVLSEKALRESNLWSWQKTANQIEKHLYEVA